MMTCCFGSRQVLNDFAGLKVLGWEKKGAGHSVEKNNLRNVMCLTTEE